MNTAQTGLPIIDAPMAAAEADVPGLAYHRDFLNEEEERALIDWIDRRRWNHDLSRRVQHYGWRYDYHGRRVDSSMRLGRLPRELAALAKRLFDQGLVPQLPDQAIVNEYETGHCIRPHVDARDFADGIATISLLESWEMTFHAPRGKTKVHRLLERRSVAALCSEARYRWKHEIKKRDSDPPLDGVGPRRPRQRRISLTFRRVARIGGQRQRRGGRLAP